MTAARMTSNSIHDTVEAEIVELEHLGLDALRALWQDLTGKPAPKFFRRKFLIRAVAYQVQVKAFGGLDTKTKKRLRKIADDVCAGKPVAVSSPRPIKSGTRLVRAWGDKVHTVTVVGGAFEYEGERYTSLSAIAREITGTSWNGPQFFGLRNKKRAAQHGQGLVLDEASITPRLKRTSDTAPCVPNQLERFDA